MLLFTGAVFLALGLLSGIVLLLAPFGVFATGPGLTLWVMFPLLSLLGYAMFVMQAGQRQVRLLSLAASGLLLLLALGSVAALVLGAAAIVAPPDGTASLWFVLVVGLVFGASGAAAFGRQAS